MKRNKNSSPYKVEPKEMVEQAKRNLAWMERNYPRMVLEGKISAWSSQHKQEVQRATITALEACLKGQQIDLFHRSDKNTDHHRPN